MELHNESWLPWLLKVVGPFGFFAMLAALILALTGLVLCFTVRSRRKFLIYLLLAQLPILLCVAGAMRNWLIVSTVVRQSDVVLKPNEWAELWKEAGVMVLWGVGWSLPCDLLAWLGLRPHVRANPGSNGSA